MAQLNFDATNVPHDIGFDPIPAGWYKAVMDESEMKPTKAGDGAYLNCRFAIVDGPYTGRKLFARLNLRNANAQAQEIGFKQLSAIAHAVGVLQVADSSQLHGIPLQLKVKLRKDQTGEYEDQNEVTSYKNINDVVGATAAAPVAPGNSYPPPPGAPPAGWGAPPPPAPAQQGWGPPPAPAAAPQGAWQQPQGGQPWGAPPQQPAAQQAPAAAPAPWTPPGGGQPWQAQPPAAPGAAPAAAPTPPQPPHPAQGAVPPWQQPK